MASYRTTIHHGNFTAVGVGYNVTNANSAALMHYVKHSEADPLEENFNFVCNLAHAVRSARRGGVGEVKWRIDRDKSFIIVERV